MIGWKHVVAEIPLLQQTDCVVFQSPSDLSVLLAPIDVHRNHKHTLFGGSISLLTTALGWFHIARQGQHRQLPSLVVKSQHINYLKPISHDGLFVAHITDHSERDGRCYFTVECSAYDSVTGVIGAIATLDYVLLEN